MKVCIFGSANNSIDDVYKQKTFELSKKLGERGHSLVFGAGSEGLMGESAKGFKQANAQVLGVIPKFFEESRAEIVYKECDKLVYTQTMAERKATMENECDCFVIVPGGIGTLEEFYEVFTLKQLGRHKKAIAIYNIDGFYDSLIKFMEYITEKGFLTEKSMALIKSFSNGDDIINYLENYTADGINWNRLKRE